MYSFSLSAIAIGVLACLTVGNIFTMLLPHSDSSTTQRGEQYYTYIGDAFPEVLPLPSARPVALVVEDPAHYSISGLDAREEWAANTPKGYSYVRLGPEYRTFAVSMFHELHCLRLMRSALAGDHRPATDGHFGHCLIYLRQLILCNPDLTLEPPDVMDHDYDVKQDGSTHICQDWRQVYDAMASNWDQWVDVRRNGFRPKNASNSNTCKQFQLTICLSSYHDSFQDSETFQCHARGPG
ncbi:hypothetical protein BV20DRAFT_941747 [Pilatotrama ljubarskyi]|nr:hypothetical protein BV20DRAFT_941747 [Pilatotrama ljubarskyi]